MQTSSFDLFGLIALISVIAPVALAAAAALQQHLSSRKQSISIFGPVGVSRVRVVRKRDTATQEAASREVTERLAA
jgi:hypothetical protein